MNHNENAPDVMKISFKFSANAYFYNKNNKQEIIIYTYTKT